MKEHMKYVTLEKRIEKVIEKNPELMNEYAIATLKEFAKALGDRYNSELRNAIMSRLTPREKIWVKEYYLHNCNAGKDRYSACIKVMMDWTRGSSWAPCGRDFLSNVKAEFDRINSTVKYTCKTKDGIAISMQSSLDEKFEDKFFSFAEDARWKTATEDGSFAMDSNPVSIICEFGGDGFICKMNGNIPDYYPYNKLYEMARVLFVQMKEPLQGAKSGIQKPRKSWVEAADEWAEGNEQFFIDQEQRKIVKCILSNYMTITRTKDPEEITEETLNESALRSSCNKYMYYYDVAKDWILNRKHELLI